MLLKEYIIYVHTVYISFIAAECKCLQVQYSYIRNNNIRYPYFEMPINRHSFSPRGKEYDVSYDDQRPECSSEWGFSPIVATLE